MLGFDAVAKSPLAAAGSSYSLDLANGAFVLDGQPAGFQRTLFFECATGPSSVSGNDCNGLLGKVIQAAASSYQYDGVAVTLDATWYDPNSPARLVTFKFIRANTLSILSEDRVIKVEPRLRKSN